MANQILIEFKPHGDEKLIKAIERLASAQNKLNKSTKKSNSVANEQINTHRKLNAGMSKLRASFKAQGKSLMDAGVSAKLYKKALLGNVVAQERVRLAVKKYNKDLAQASIATRILGGSVAVLRSKMLIFAFAMGIVKRPFEELINAYSRATEVGGKFDVVFGQTRDMANQFAESLGKNFGRATTDIKEFMSSLQDTFVPLGFSRVASAKLSATLTQLSLDVASFNNKMDADVVRDFQSAIVGNHETVKKYGIIINEVTIGQKAIEMGLVESAKELTEYDKVLARVNLLQSGTADAQGDVTRTFDTLANSIKATKAEFTAFKEEFGEILEPLAMFLLEIGKLAMNLLRLIKLPLTILTTAFSAVGQILNSVNIVMGGFFDLFKKGIPELDEATKQLMEMNDGMFVLAEGVDASSLALAEGFIPQVQSLIREIEIANMGIWVYSNTILSLPELYKQTTQAQVEYLDNLIKEYEGLGTLTENSHMLIPVLDMLREKREKLLTKEDIKLVNDYAQEWKNMFSVWDEGMREIEAMIKKIEDFTKSVVASSFSTGQAYDDMGEAINAGLQNALIQTIRMMTIKLKEDAVWRFGWLGIPLAATAGSVVGSLVGQASRHWKFEDGGLVGGRRHSQGGTMIEAERGEFVMSRNAVDAIGVENLNRMNQGGGGGVNITFSGNVMSQDFIENEAIPQIKDAIRRGADIGVS